MATVEMDQTKSVACPWTGVLNLTEKFHRKSWAMTGYKTMEVGCSSKGATARWHWTGRRRLSERTNMFVVRHYILILVLIIIPVPFVNESTFQSLAPGEEK